MNWFDWVLVGFFALGALLNILQIEKPRARLDAPTVAWIVILNALLIVGVVMVR